jgi:hypothetical protein
MIIDLDALTVKLHNSGNNPVFLGPSLEYTILDQNILAALGSTYAFLATVVSKGLTTILVLHPVGKNFIEQHVFALG